MPKFLSPRNYVKPFWATLREHQTPRRVSSTYSFTLLYLHVAERMRVLIVAATFPHVKMFLDSLYAMSKKSPTQSVQAQLIPSSSIKPTGPSSLRYHTSLPPGEPPSQIVKPAYDPPRPGFPSSSQSKEQKSMAMPCLMPTSI